MSQALNCGRAARRSSAATGWPLASLHEPAASTAGLSDGIGSRRGACACGLNAPSFGSPTTQLLPKLFWYDSAVIAFVVPVDEDGPALVSIFRSNVAPVLCAT